MIVTPVRIDLTSNNDKTGRRRGRGRGRRGRGTSFAVFQESSLEGMMSRERSPRRRSVEQNIWLRVRKLEPSKPYTVSTALLKKVMEKDVTTAKHRAWSVRYEPPRRETSGMTSEGEGKRMRRRGKERERRALRTVESGDEELL